MGYGCWIGSKASAAAEGAEGGRRLRVAALREGRDSCENEMLLLEMSSIISEGVRGQQRGDLKDQGSETRAYQRRGTAELFVHPEQFYELSHEII